MQEPLMGVEEEYLVVNPQTGHAVPRAAELVARCASPQITTEITRFQIEAKTAPCTDAAPELAALRAQVAAAARAEGLAVIASGTAILGDTVPPALNEHPRYAVGTATYRTLHDEQCICAVHVHVHLPDREEAVLVGNHLRPWLPTLIALTANSPFWQGRDTGYASRRVLAWAKWPVAGPPPYFTCYADYERIVAQLTEARVLVDPGTIFWDVRPSVRVPTLEVRVADVPPTAAASAWFARLVRALVTVSLARVRDGDPGPPVSAELLRAAYWQAARDGLDGGAIDPLSGRLLPASERVRALLEHVREAADLKPPPATGAALQREAYARGGARGAVKALVEAFEAEG
ncbi:glutamate--cysteine ligase [Streptomyces polyrhachis]|uniref:Putative glutamate--cysteine ligase 2 n=1 Tax=Streptomyces polyrhachis TaxID=1282885 RepID=A0ABW2GLM7_9ACTN